MITLISCLILNLWAEKFDQPHWQNWKSEQYKNALTSPTSFLNATQLSFQESGSLYLVVGKTRKDTRWVKEEPKKYEIIAEHQGDRIRVQVRKKSSQYLTKQKRRQEIKLPNGAIAEVVFGRRVGKLWGYVYDPDQIKKFTGFRFYPFNEKAIVTGHFKKHPKKFVSYKTVQGDLTKVSKVGTVSFIFNGVETYLNAYNWQKENEALKYIALVFTDLTGGSETYAGGRELVVELEKPLKDGQKFTLDFNRTTNFYCAHSPFWHCPTGLQQKVNSAFKAGEMLPLKKIVSSR